MESQETQNSQDNFWEKKNRTKLEETSPNFKIYYKAIKINTVVLA